MNMFIAFISYSYTEGISDNDEVQESLEEELEKQYWTIYLLSKYRKFVSYLEEINFFKCCFKQHKN